MAMELIFSGFGGQGVLTAGLIVAHAANETGKNVLWSPSYGSEMRGGTAHCMVTIGDEEIGSPDLPECDALVAMNEPSLDKFKSRVRKGGHIIVNGSIVPGDYLYPEGVNVLKVDAKEISVACGNERGTNLVMLGALCGATGLFSREVIIRQTDNYFSSKAKQVVRTAECVAGGYEYAL